ncbi:hypothetical protein [Streptomyces virginiae]|uniref:hypothetical protein n=1 Tax=Streptomyces virginiae TaxID=1961 RepID=UPI003659588F
MTRNLTPVATVHAAIAAYRAMDARHRVALNTYTDEDGDIPENAMPAYNEARFTYALEADEHLHAVMSELTDAFGLPTGQPVTVLGAWYRKFEVTQPPHPQSLTAPTTNGLAARPSCRAAHREKNS